MAWVTEWAPLRADIESCVACGLCLPYCPTYRLTGDEAASPRGRLAAMAAVADGVAEVDGRFEEMMSFCLQCRACEAVCPSMVPFGRVMEGTRAELAAQLPTPRRVSRRWIFGRAIDRRGLVSLATAGLSMAQKIGATTFLPGTDGLRRVFPHSGTPGRSWDPEGEPVGTVALFSGCVMDAWLPGVHEALIGILRVAGYRVEAPASQACCGALAAHEGAAPDAAKMARRNVEAFDGYDVVVVDSAGCGAHLKELSHWADGGANLASHVVDATEYVVELIEDGRLPEIDVPRGTVAVQDPCHLRHAQRIVDEPRRLLRAGGYEPIDIDVHGLCCGAAGSYVFTHPDTSADLGRMKADQIRQSGATTVSSANPGCDIQLRRYLGDGYRVAHPIELYWEAVSG